MCGIVSGHVRGIYTTGLSHVSRLRPGVIVSQGPFLLFRLDILHEGTRDGYNYLGYWDSRDKGFVGFKFNNGAGVQYGWIRVTMARSNAGFKVVDYAYADPGESIKTRQKKSHEKAPDQGSLGWLALGASGLLVWRNSRSRNTR